MKKFWGLVTVLLTISAANASTRSIGIVNIETVEGDESSFAIYATDGQIYEISDQDELTLEQAILAKENKEQVEIEVTEFSDSEDVLGLRSQILDLKRMSVATDEAMAPAPDSNSKLLYNPGLILNDYITNFRDESGADTVFRAQRTDTREKSQCYNRAHVWAWEMRRFTEGGNLVQPGKMWLYFTKKYIRSHRYKWWFHVAPFVQVRGQDTVMDRKFLNGPILRRGWTDFFIQPRTECPVITRYSQYENNPYVGNCFLMRTSVHYYQPYQAENLENGRGREQTSWQQWELKQAYRDGVGSRSVPNL